jgi:hypothetical protein
MKYRITKGVNNSSGSLIYRIYRIDGEIQILIDAEVTMEKAQAHVNRLLTPIAEQTVYEVEI